MSKKLKNPNSITEQLMEVLNQFSDLKKQLAENELSIDRDKPELEQSMTDAITKAFKIPVSDKVVETSRIVLQPLIDGNKYINADIKNDLEQDERHFINSLESLAQEFSQYIKDSKKNSQ